MKKRMPVIIPIVTIIYLTITTIITLDTPSKEPSPVKKINEKSFSEDRNERWRIGIMKYKEALKRTREKK